MTEMIEARAPYPILDSLPTDVVDHQIPAGPIPPLSAQSDTNDSKSRKHAACDECRKRKLKCSGEPAGCSRCVKNGIPCIYSQQKQMGRPRKRQRLDEDSNSPGPDEVRYTQPGPPPRQSQSQPHIDALPPSDTPIDPSLANIDQELTDQHNVCTAPMAQTVRREREVNGFRQASTANANMFEQGGDVMNGDFSVTKYPTDIALWPDFSTVDTLPLPMTTKYDPNPAHDVYHSGLSTASTAFSDHENTYYDPDVDPAALAALPAIPACPCLPNLYLALSTLSTLTSFPITQNTIDTLLSAHKTAHSVIYCPVCPLSFQSGSQNLMLGCTLLNVVADHWFRVRNATSEALKKGFGSTMSNSYQVNGNGFFIGVKEGLAWRKFAQQLVRAYVYGDVSIPKPPPPSNAATSGSSPESNVNGTSNGEPSPTADIGPRVPETSTLDFLISALERRQRQWHRLDSPTDEFPDRPGDEHVHNPTSGMDLPRPRSIVEAHIKHCDKNKTKNGSAADEENGDDKNNGENNGTEAEKREQRRKGLEADHLLCLMIVQRSRDVMERLSMDK